MSNKRYRKQVIPRADVSFGTGLGTEDIGGHVARPEMIELATGWPRVGQSLQEEKASSSYPLGHISRLMPELGNQFKGRTLERYYF